MAVRRSKSKTALRGAVNNIIMESLFEGEKYGYEIIKEVEEKTQGKIKLKQPSLYSSLSRFETKGLITSYWQDSDIGGKRHYYKLTDAGIEHYKKNVLKEDDDYFNESDNDEKFIADLNLQKETINEEEHSEDMLEEYEIDSHEEVQDISKYEYNVEDKIKSLLGEDSDDEFYEEIYSEEDLEEDVSTQTTEEIIYDHEFRPSTILIDTVKEENNESLIKESDYTENAFNDILENESDDIFDDIDLDKSYEATSSEYVENKEKESTLSKPRIITDENGITKMYYEDIQPQKRSNKVFDNVVYRTNSHDNLFKARSSSVRNIDEQELSEEEKELKSKNFMERFDIKSEQLKREKQYNAPAPKPSIDSQKIDYSYKSKLNDLFNSVDDDDEEETFISQEVDFEEYSPNYNFSADNDEGNFDNQTDIDDYSTQLNDNGYSIKVFTEEKKKTPTAKFLLVNRAKFSFGLCMLVFMLVQLTAMLFVFKNKNLLSNNQFWVFQISYIMIAIVALIYCIPVFMSPNKQTPNTFKLTYSLMFGLLAFFNVVIVTYAINTFIGMDIKNLKYYLVTMIVPIGMALNFIFGPLIYWLITQNKRYYN